DDREKEDAEIEVLVEGEEDERRGENPDAAEGHCAGGQHVTGAGDGERGHERADAAAGHEQAVAVRAEVQDITRERGHEDGIRPAENSDDGEERENGEDARMRPNVAESFERLADRAGVAVDAHDFSWQSHQETAGADGTKAEAI